MLCANRHKRMQRGGMMNRRSCQMVIGRAGDQFYSPIWCDGSRLAQGIVDGHVNALFPRRSDYCGRPQDSSLLKGTPYVVVKAGSSLAIRVQTPGINPMLSFEDERDKVERVLRAIRDMILSLRANRGDLTRPFNTN